jgi:RHS repeat-associated protein
MRHRLLALVLAILLLVPFTPASYATPPDAYTCLHPDVAVSAGGELLSKGDEIALDGGMAHAGTGLTFSFQARTFNPTIDLCNLKITDPRTWQVGHWPCDNYPKPKPARTQSLAWSVAVPLDCKFIGSPNLLTVSLTNGKGSAVANVMIYAGAPGFVFPDKQARAFFGPFAMQSDPVNSLTGALAAVETDASVTALGVPLSVTRTYNSNDESTGPLGVGWRSSYSDRLALSPTGARYLASDGREIGFTRTGTGFAVEPGTARFTLTRSGSTYVLTSFDQVRMQFSAAGELQSIRDRNGQGVTIEQVSGRIRTVTNGRRSLSYDYNEQGQITSVRLSGPGVAPRTVRYSYADGRLTEVTSAGGIWTRYSYVDGRLKSESVGDARPAYVTEYDSTGRVVAQTDAKGGRSTWSWDTEGIRATSTMTDPMGGKWINEYERNWLIRQTDPTGATATFHYDADGNLIRVFDNLGHGARHSYDALGRDIASADAVGAVTRRTYNGRNDVLSSTDPLGRRTTYTYDARGNLTATSYGGRTSAVTYDARGLVTTSRDPLGRTTQYAYSVDGDLVRVTDPLRQVTQIGYDGWGRPAKVTSPRGAVSTVTYNDDDQPLTQHGPLDVSTSQTYDAQGRVTTLVDARGGTTKLRYDDTSALVGVTRPSLPEATTTYDGSDRVTKTVDASGREQTFTYDGAGRTTATTYGGRTWRFTYDKSGRLIRTTLPSGKTASFTLDARGAPLRIAYSDKTPAVSYTWDAAGRRTSMTDGRGVTRFGYDAFDELTSSTGPAGAVSYRWDANGNLTGRTAADHTEAYTWDAVGRLASAVADGKPLASYGYDLAHGTITTTQPGGLVKTERVDVRGRTTSLSVARSGHALRTITSAYDSADNVIRSDDSVAGKASYNYDPLNRLTAVCYGVDQCADDASDYIRYNYDANGNRIWQQRPTGSTWSLYGSGNELQASITSPPAYPLDVPSARVYTYDADGNLTSDGTTTYTWSAAGKPITSTTAGATTTYTHSGDGRRTSATTGRSTTRYLWDPLSPQILNTTKDSKPTRYLYGASLLAQQTPSALTPLTTSPNGSILTTSTAKPTQHAYEPYGQTRAGPAVPTPSKPTADQPSAPAPGYIGGLQLPNGNYLLGQREYNPTTGTFLTPDQAGSANPYAYTSGNPLKTTDLQGLDDVEGTLTDVSHISGYISTAALVGAVVCTLARPCAPAVPIFLEVSSATGVISAGAAGILDSQACILKGNCSQLAADIGVGLVASRFPALGRARNDARAQVVQLGPDSARTLGARNGLEMQMSREEADAISSKAGYLKPEVIDSARLIIRGEDLGNRNLIQQLTMDGSRLEDWGKYSTKTYRSPSGPFQVHFYYNKTTGRMDYGVDYKVKFN